MGISPNSFCSPRARRVGLLSGTKEWLIILSDEGADEARKRLSAHHRIVQVASPRVVVVQSPEKVEPDMPLRSIPGVVTVTDGEAPPEVMEGLDESEALFVAAWSSRIKQGPSKERRGEGLPWDAPGFEPPDPPIYR